MKFQFRKILEKFPPPYPGQKGTKIIHFEKHVQPNGINPQTGEEEFNIEDIPDADTYERLADKLALTPCNTSDYHKDDTILGFVGTDDKTVKFNRKTREMVVYRPDKSISNGVRLITYYIASGLSRYLELKYRSYASEIEAPVKEETDND